MPNEPPTSWHRTRTCCSSSPRCWARIVLHHVRHLGALVDGQALLALVPVGHDGAGLQRDAGVAAEDGSWLSTTCPAWRSAASTAPASMPAFEGEIVAERRDGSRRRRVERRQRVHDGGSGSYSTAICSAASSACARVAATTIATGSPCQQARVRRRGRAAARISGRCRWVSTPTQGVQSWRQAGAVDHGQHAGHGAGGRQVHAA